MVVFSDLEVSVRGATAEASASQRAALDRDGYAIVSAVVQHHELDAIWRYRAEPTLREHGVLIDNPTSWDTGSPLWALLDERKAYRNREGAQLQTASTEHFDVLDRAPELERSLGDGLPKWVARGQCLKRLHLRYPLGLVSGANESSLPAFGWHIERGAGHNLRRVAIVHLTDVFPRGGGVAVILGSHRLVRWLRPLLWPRAPYVVGVILAHVLAKLAKWFVPDRVVEVCARAGDAVVLDPFVVHAPSANLSRSIRFTYQIRCES